MITPSTNSAQYRADKNPSLPLGTVRATRGNLLFQSDWTQFSDSPLSQAKKDEWKVYRQALRDLTTTIDLNNPIFPTPPA